MMVRRRVVSMSVKDGSVLARYHGADRRRWVTISGLWPCRAYQTTTRLYTYMPNAQVRSTARGARLRAWPTPRVWRQSKNVTSMAQRIAYLATRSATPLVRVGGDQGQHGGFRIVAVTYTDHAHRDRAERAVPQAVDPRRVDGLDASVAGHLDRPPEQIGGDFGGLTQLGALQAGPAPLAGALRGPAIQGGVTRQAGGPGDLFGPATHLLAVVGGIGHHVDAPAGQAGGDGGHHLAGQLHGGGGCLALPAAAGHG